jgi:hypothetical protein
MKAKSETEGLRASDGSSCGRALRGSTPPARLQTRLPALALVAASCTLPAVILADDSPSIGREEPGARICTSAASDEDSTLGAATRETWHGVTAPADVRRDLVRDTFSRIDGHLFEGDYRIVPQLRGRSDPRVVYYLAYNQRTGRVDYAVGPAELACFRAEWERFAAAAE